MKYCPACTQTPHLDEIGDTLCETCKKLFEKWYESDPTKYQRFLRERWLDVWFITKLKEMKDSPKSTPPTLKE